MNGSEIALFVSVVAKRPPRRADGTRYGCVRNKSTLPDSRDKFVLRHHPVAPLDQMKNKIQHLWLDPDGRAGRDQLPRRGVDDEGVGYVPHAEILLEASGL